MIPQLSLVSYSPNIIPKLYSLRFIFDALKFPSIIWLIVSFLVQNSLTSCYFLLCCEHKSAIFIFCMCVDQLQAQSSVQPAVQRAREFERMHCRGTFRLNPHDLIAPGKDIMVRSLDPKGVSKLAASFETLQRINEDIMAVIRDPALVDKKLEPEDLMTAKLEVFAGWHSANALQQLATKQPQNPLWKDVPVKVFVTDESLDAANQLMLLGGIDNTAKQNVVATPWGDILVSMHRQYFARVAADSQFAHDRESIGILKEEWEATYNLSHSTINSMFSLAVRQGTTWETLEKALTGRDCHPKYQPPTSMYAFGFVAGIPDSVWTAWLRDSMDNGGNYNQFRTKCQNYKLLLRLRAQVIRYIHGNSTLPALRKVDSSAVDNLEWGYIEGLYPRTCNSAFVDSLIATIPKAQKRKKQQPSESETESESKAAESQLPLFIQQQLSATMREDDDARERPQQVSLHYPHALTLCR